MKRETVAAALTEMKKIKPYGFKKNAKAEDLVPVILILNSGTRLEGTMASADLPPSASVEYVQVNVVRINDASLTKGDVVVMVNLDHIEAVAANY